MAYVSASVPGKLDGSYSIKNICRVVGLVCVAGFIFDMLVLTLPPQFGVEWRIGVIQQFANRSIILLFGLALIIFGSQGNSTSRMRLMAKVSMGLGVLFFLLSLLSVVDSVRLSQRAVSNISTQESELQTQLRDAQANPEGLPDNVNLEDLTQFSQQLTAQADTLKKNAQRTVLKTGISNIGNLVLVGAGLLALGRGGMRLSRTKG